MRNRNIEEARRYHDESKHSVARLQASRHVLDWEIQPLPFKVYRGLRAIPLPEPRRGDGDDAFRALAGAAAAEAPVTFEGLSRILRLSCGVTKTKKYADGHEHSFRAAACTGALYHVDAYVVCGDLPGLQAGVYHFAPQDAALRPLRPGDLRAVLAEASGAEPSVCQAPALLAFASTYWRNSWKYGGRTYRHCFWDCGTILANALAAAAAEGVPARVVAGFVDSTVHRLLGLDPYREGALAVLSLGQRASTPAAGPPELPALHVDTVPLSSREVDYPEIRGAHEASRLSSADEVSVWRSAAPEAPAPVQPAPSGPCFPLQPLVEDALPREPLPSVIRRRGSSRQFSHRAISFDELSTLLRVAAQDISADFGASPNRMYLIVHAVDGLPAGSYVYRSCRDEIELLEAGDFRAEAGFLGLGQRLPADASVNLYFCCDLAPVLDRFGNRGYRVAQLDAAVRAGRVYLASYALGLGATGLTFLDDEVTEFFSPDARGSSVMFLVAVGAGDGRRRTA